VARKGESAKDSDEASTLARLTDLVALLVVKGESQPEKIRCLHAVGYAPAAIAALLSITPNAVSIALHRLKKQAGRSK
jgi:hypothetical protein